MLCVHSDATRTPSQRALSPSRRDSEYVCMFVVYVRVCMCVRSLTPPPPPRHEISSCIVARTARESAERDGCAHNEAEQTGACCVCIVCVCVRVSSYTLCAQDGTLAHVYVDVIEATGIVRVVCAWGVVCVSVLCVLVVWCVLV
jgi:hypothetical protein